MLLAAVDAGDVALAFEYAGLLAPRMDYYTLLMAAYAIRGDLGAVQLGLNTALRRRIEPDAMAFAVTVAAAALVSPGEATPCTLCGTWVACWTNGRAELKHPPHAHQEAYGLP